MSVFSFFLYFKLILECSVKCRIYFEEIMCCLESIVLFLILFDKGLNLFASTFHHLSRRSLPRMTILMIISCVIWCWRTLQKRFSISSLTTVLPYLQYFFSLRFDLSDYRKARLLWCCFRINQISGNSFWIYFFHGFLCIVIMCHFWRNFTDGEKEKQKEYNFSFFNQIFWLLNFLFYLH